MRFMMVLTLFEMMEAKHPSFQLKCRCKCSPYFWACFKFLSSRLPKVRGFVILLIEYFGQFSYHYLISSDRRVEVDQTFCKFIKRRRSSLRMLCCNSFSAVLTSLLICFRYLRNHTEEEYIRRRISSYRLGTFIPLRRVYSMKSGIMAVE